MQEGKAITVGKGTPFWGSFLGEFPEILEFIGMSDDPTNENFTYGVQDILDETKSLEFQERWNGEYFESYSSQNLANIQDAHIQIIVVDKISNIGYSFYIYHGSDSILNNWSNDIWDET